jgi:two-component system, response regulator PdtaR
MDGHTVVVADDEAHVLNTLSQLLESAGYVVVGSAKTGAEAVALNRSLQPDVLLLDLRMPGMDGLEAVKRIMAERPAPIVACSAYHDDKLIAEASGVGVYSYVTKPCRQETLVAALNVAMSRFDEAKRLRDEVCDLKETLEARKWIERAKPIIMQVRGLSEEDAHQFLKTASRKQGKPVAILAEAIVSTECALFGDTADSASQVGVPLMNGRTGKTVSKRSSTQAVPRAECVKSAA